MFQDRIFSPEEFCGQVFSNLFIMMLDMTGGWLFLVIWSKRTTLLKIRLLKDLLASKCIKLNIAYRRTAPGQGLGP
jgi:hypothetical protein